MLLLEVTANAESMLKRLEEVFGNVSTGESILHEVYTAFQKQEKSIANWLLRLEEILQKVINKGHVKEEDTNKILRQNFWRSLRSDRLKNATRVHFEYITNFDMLRSADRAEKIVAGIYTRDIWKVLSMASKLHNTLIKCYQIMHFWKLELNGYLMV